MKDVTGLDYINTLNTFGSRLALETKMVMRRWFRSAKDFCVYYNITSGGCANSFYRPVLSRDDTFFVTKQLYPGDVLYPRVNCSVNLRRKSTATMSEEEVNCSFKSNQDCGSMVLPSLGPGNTAAGGSDQLNTSQSQDEDDTESVQSDYQPPIEYEHKNQMLMAYFDDPLFPYLMRDLLKTRGNKPLLRMYERGLPSWAMFLPSYGLPYRPWMRKVMTVLIFLVSLFTMLLGFYDLYKNIPLLRETMQNTFGTLYQWLEDTCVIRLGFLLTWIVSSSQFCQSFIAYPFKLLFPVFSPLIPVVVCVLDLLGNSFLSVVLLLAKVVHGIAWLFGTVLFAVRKVFTLPIDVSWGLLSVLWGILVDFYRAIANVLGLFRSTGGAISSASQATSLFTDIKTFWQDIVRNVLKGITAIYNFTVYSCCNLYKYKDSTIMTLDQYYRTHYKFVWDTVQFVAMTAVVVFVSILLYELAHWKEALVEEVA